MVAQPGRAGEPAVLRDLARKRTLAGVIYLGLVIALGVLTSVTFIEREL